MNELISKFGEHGYLVSPDLIKSFKSNVDDFLSFVKTKYPSLDLVNTNIYKEYLNTASKPNIPFVKILKNYELTNESRDINHFISFYNSRFEKLKKILQNRPELSSIVSINKANSINLTNFSVIGIVNEFHETGSGNVILDVEDQTGSLKVIVSKNGPLINLTSELVEDEVIGLNLTKNGRWFFVNNIVFPDVPQKPIKKCSEDINAVFISDTHAGSNIFLSDVFQKFIDWLNCKNGNDEQKNIANKVRYLFFIGDLVDGVGVYPGQEEELDIKDVYKQYELVASYLKQVPEHIKIIICPGNHDALRLALPQQPLNNDYSAPINSLPNVISVSNPSYVNVGYSHSFEGYDVLMYHGNSFDFFVHNVPFLRKTGYERPDLIMEFLLKKRHLCPTHGSTLIAPSLSDNHLIIDKIPDIFATGHIHQSSVSQYKGVITMNTSCFQAQSDFMKRVGVNPKPGRVPIFNFKTRKTKILNFLN